MNQRELKELVEFLIEKDITEFELERGDVKVRIKRGGESHAGSRETHFVAVHPAAPAPGVASSPAVAAAPAPASSAEENEGAGVHVIRSPIVGTFYESPSPGAPAFVKVGDTVQSGQVLCIIEAMKLMNEIESDHAGEVIKRYVANAQPVEYGQPLFAIREAQAGAARAS